MTCIVNRSDLYVAVLISSCPKTIDRKSRRRVAGLGLNSKCPYTPRIIHLLFCFSFSFHRFIVSFMPPPTPTAACFPPFSFLRRVDQINKYSCKRLIDFQMRRGASVIHRYPGRIWSLQTAAEFRLTQKGLLMIPIKQEADGERGRGSTC